MHNQTCRKMLLTSPKQRGTAEETSVSDYYKRGKFENIPRHITNKKIIISERKSH